MDQSVFSQLKSGITQRDKFIAQLLVQVEAMELCAKQRIPTSPPGSQAKSWRLLEHLKTRPKQPKKKKWSTKAAEKKAKDTLPVTPKKTLKLPKKPGSKPNTPVKQGV